MLDAPDHAAMIDRITNAKFDTTRLKPGYDEKEVDDFLDQVVAQLRGGGLPEARGARFSPTRMRPGYAQQDVDDLLDEIDLYAKSRRSPDHAAMIDRITNAKFDTTRLKPSYDEKEVDDFLDQVVARLRAGALPDVRGARFSPTRMRPGYVQQDVDDLLREIDLYAEPRRSALGPQGAASPGSDRRASARPR
jgi:DivIVA domain-containing protein